MCVFIELRPRAYSIHSEAWYTWFISELARNSITLVSASPAPIMKGDIKLLEKTHSRIRSLFVSRSNSKSLGKHENGTIVTLSGICFWGLPARVSALKHVADQKAAVGSSAKPTEKIIGYAEGHVSQLE